MHVRLRKINRKGKSVLSSRSASMSVKCVKERDSHGNMSFFYQQDNFFIKSQNEKDFIDNRGNMT